MNAHMDPHCPCCGDSHLRVLGKLPDSHWFAGKRLAQLLPGGKLYRCHLCQLKFRYPAQEPAVYQQMYDNAATMTWPTDTARPDWDLITDYIRKHLPRGGRVLDFGCYTGGLLARLGPIYERYGVEVNCAAAGVASEKSRVHVWSSADEIPGELRFDVVVSTDVIEHIPNPRGLIDKLTSLTTDSGFLIITTGDADNPLWNRFGANWWYCFYPEHIAFLSRDWLTHLSQTEELFVIHCETFRYSQLTTARHFVNAVLTYCYGLFPRAYLFLGPLLKKTLGRPAVKSVPGCGISADHLFIVLSRKAQP